VCITESLRHTFICISTPHYFCSFVDTFIPTSEQDTAYRFTLKRHSLLISCLLLFILVNIGPLVDHPGTYYAVPYLDLLCFFLLAIRCYEDIFQMEKINQLRKREAIVNKIIIEQPYVQRSKNVHK